jgi:hypothetical protein
VRWAGVNSGVKVEANFVFRGTVLPVVQRPLISTAQDIFTTDITLPVLDTAELYCGKLAERLENRPICAGIAVPLLEPGDAQKRAAQGRRAAPAGGLIRAKSGGSITPKSGGPIPTKSGGSNHSKSCTVPFLQTDWISQIGDG